MKWNISTLITLLLVLSSCSSNPKQKEKEPNQHLPIGTRLKRIYTENKKEKLDFEIKYNQLVKNFYEKSDYKAIWVKDKKFTPKAINLIAFFDSTELYGLPKHLYPINELKDHEDDLTRELSLTESLFRLVINLRQGILDSNQMKLNYELRYFDLELADTLFKLKEDSLFPQLLVHFQPQNFQYQWLQSSWARYYRNSKFDTTQFKVPKMKTDSLRAYEVTREILFHRRYFDSLGLTNDTIFLEALEKYQKEHALKGDHIIGSNTITALEKSNFNKFQQVVLALDKLKWTQNLPQKYFRVNIPEQKIRLIDSNRVIREHRIIVGEYETQTPELTSKLRRMVLYPYWHVPHSIASTEILYGVKRDTGFFRKKNYKLFRGKTEIDPTTINWKKYSKDKFPFRVRQEPGPKNSLGLIKFLFPNEHSVYIHDTPVKWLFKTKMRYYSHGCMRLEDPREMAQYIIATDPKNKFIADSLEVEMDKETQQSIYLRKPIPIFVEYISVVGDSTGNIVFYNDFYRRDEKFIQAIFANH